MAAADCHVLDVGQGMSSVVVLPGGRALVIDCGPTAKVALGLLQSLAPVTLESIVVSHNDDDHARGAIGLAVEHFATLERVYILQDRPVEELHWLWELLESLSPAEQDEMNGKLVHLGVHERRQVLWPREPVPRADEPRVTLLHPSLLENLAAQLSGRTNASSAVLELRCGTGSVLFPGDAPEETWSAIHARYGRIACDVLVFPHHGAAFGRGSAPATRAADLEWFLREAIECRQLVVFSVGTNNSYGHPLQEVVDSVRKAGAAAACTQVTPRCAPDPKSVAPGLMPPEHYRVGAARCALPPRGKHGAGCIGSVRIELRGGAAHVPALAEHQRLVDGATRLGWRPMCRAAHTSPPTTVAPARGP